MKRINRLFFGLTSLLLAGSAVLLLKPSAVQSEAHPSALPTLAPEFESDVKRIDVQAAEEALGGPIARPNSVTEHDWKIDKIELVQAKGLRENGTPHPPTVMIYFMRHSKGESVLLFQHPKWTQGCRNDVIRSAFTPVPGTALAGYEMRTSAQRSYGVEIRKDQGVANPGGGLLWFDGCNSFTMTSNLSAERMIEIADAIPTNTQ
jgi:hypothetical protein